jgi:hypothetical protein
MFVKVSYLMSAGVAVWVAIVNFVVFSANQDLNDIEINCLMAIGVLYLLHSITSVTGEIINGCRGENPFNWLIKVFNVGITPLVIWSVVILYQGNFASTDIARAFLMNVIYFVAHSIIQNFEKKNTQPTKQQTQFAGEPVIMV